MFTEILAQQNEAIFVVSLDGKVIKCNTTASMLFGYKSPAQLKGVSVAEKLVPEDFQKLFPQIITEEHLTKGQYLARVNRRLNGSLFASQVLTYYTKINQTTFIIVHVTPLDGDNSKIPLLCLQQNIEVLQAELNRMKKETENNRSSLLNNTIESLLLKIKKEVSELTTTDIQYCKLLLEQKTTPEIANIMNITTNGVFAARKRIRKKIGLPQAISLTQYLARGNNSTFN